MTPNIENATENATETETTAKRSPLVRFAPIIIIVGLLVLAFVVISRPEPGRKTSTATSTTVIVSAADPVESVEYPIALQEGGDAAHEADHVFGSLNGVEGIATAKLDWSNGVVLTVEYDPAVIEAQQIASIVMSSGYLSPTPAQ
jgi:hypothetical protein